MANVRQTKKVESKPRNGIGRRELLIQHLKSIAKDVENTETLANAPDVSRYVPTLFPSFNRAIQLGGAPVRCLWLVHGPTEEGKSTFCAGLVASFQRLGHLTAYIDAEHGVLSKTWFSQLGVDPSLLLFEQPDFLEDAVNKVDQWVTKFDELKEQDPDLCFIIILDSLSKFTPRSEFERFQKDGAEAMDKGLARFRGLYLQTWLDHLTPIIGKRDIALVCIGQERVTKQDAKVWEKDYRIKGCQGAGFDASVRFRVQFGEKIKIGGSKKMINGQQRTVGAMVVGQAHRIWVFKNRVGYPNEMGTFYTSNGQGPIPIGFDYGREILDEGVKQGIIQKAGSWYAYNGERLGQGEANAALALQDPTMSDEIRNAIATQFQRNK